MTPSELRSARKVLGMTQYQLASALGMGRWAYQTLSKWENGDKPIPSDKAAAIRMLLRLQGGNHG